MLKKPLHPITRQNDEEYELVRYQQHLVIDKNTLDDHLEEQAALAYEISDRLALCIDERDRADRDIKKIDAQIDNQIRGEEEGKKTEPHIKASIEGDPRHLAAVDRYLTAKLRANKWEAMRDAYSQRSHSLKELGELYLADYYSIRQIRGQDAAGREAGYKRDREALAEARRPGKATD